MPPPRRRSARAGGRPADAAPEREDPPSPAPAAAPAPAQPAPADEDPAEGATCTICLDPITNAGPHRAAALRCGHLFGAACIRQWLQEGQQRCPQCNKKARTRDICLLYNLPVAVAAAPAPPPEDAAAVAELRAQLERERREREALSLQLQAQAQQQRAQQVQQQRSLLWLGQQGPRLAAAMQLQAQPAPSFHLPLSSSYPHPQQHQQQRAAGITGVKRPAGGVEPEVVDLTGGDGGASSSAAGGGGSSSGAGAWGGGSSSAGGGGGGGGSSSAGGITAGIGGGGGGAGGVTAGIGGGGGEARSGAAAVEAAAAGGQPHLRLVPLPRWGRASDAGAGSSNGSGDGPAVAPGGLHLAQVYRCGSSRAFSLEGSTLLLSEAGAAAGGGHAWGGAAQQRLRKTSIYVPEAAVYIPLPGATTVRAVCPQPGSKLAAIGTAGAGLLVASTASDAVVHRLALPGGAAVWSAAWSAACDQQLLLGLDHGRLALVDLRMTGREHKGLVLSASGERVLGRQPLLRVAPVPAALGGVGAGGGGGLSLVATPGGVYSFSDRGGGAFAPLLDARALGGGSCEDISVEPGDGNAPLLCASFRSRLAGGGGGSSGGGGFGLSQAPQTQQQERPAALSLYRLARAEEGDEEGEERSRHASLGPSPGGGGSGGGSGAFASPPPPLPTAELTGHASSRVATSGTFARLPASDAGAGGLAYFSGDEATASLAGWDCRSGASLRRWPWAAFEGPVVQVSAAARGGGAQAPLIAALCETQLMLFEWAPDAPAV